MGWPGDLLGAAGLWCEDCLLAFSSQLPLFVPPRGPGSSWSARSC